jgi:hypothetical protein
MHAHVERDNSSLDWRRAVLQCATQHPLLHTSASVSGLSALQVAPRAITMGIGLSAQHTLSRGLPLDVLGMLLPAEELRRAAGAERVVALIADRHALSNGFPRAYVQERAAHITLLLKRLRAALRLPLDILAADDVHREATHQKLHAQIRERAGEQHPYLTLEAADTGYLHQRYGSIIKIGWALDRSLVPGEVYDERVFDERFREWVGGPVGFAYARAGRTLDPRRPHAAPYVALDPARRLLLDPHEDIEAKLSAFSESVAPPMRNAVARHLRRITGAYSRVVTPLRGPLEVRLRTLLQHVFAEHRPREPSERASAWSAS